MQVFRALFPGGPLQRGPDGGVLLGFRKINVIQHGLNIKARSSGEDGNAAPAFDVRNRLLRFFLKNGDVKFFPRLQNINQKLRRLWQLHRIKFKYLQVP